MLACAGLALSACSSLPPYSGPVLAEDPGDPAVTAALARCGTNRREVERFLAAYDRGDPQERAASRWLVANMPGHGFALYALEDQKGVEIPFDIDGHATLAAAQARLDEIERGHGPVDFKVKRFDPDLERASCDFLRANLDGAFRTWRTEPWMRDVGFATFLECILPYRASNEPLCPGWRTAARARIAPQVDALGPGPTLARVTQAAIDAGHAWVPFSDRYYMHPTDQSYDDMCRSCLGRCEDITNMITFAARSCGGMVASDFTPWWANRDNNHAWEVAVDARGRGTAGLSNRAAKVYRKCFGAQASALGSVRPEDVPVPGVLRSRTLRDVTSQYLPVTDVTVPLGKPAGDLPSSFAYLAVFNGGEWRPIHWAAPKDGSATFTAMGRGILYLPVWADAARVAPAGAPFLLDDAGAVVTLADPAAGGDAFTLQAATTIPDTPDADTRRTKPSVKVEAGKEYELFVWDGAPGWRSLGKRTATGAQPVAFESVPRGVLCWLRAADGRALERPFTMGEKGQVFW